MGYIPKFIHFDKYNVMKYPPGVNWNHEYIRQSSKAIYDTFQEDLLHGISITFVVRGTSGAMIAGALLNELHHINSDIKVFIVIVRKEEDKAHCGSLVGIDDTNTTKLIVVDDFICSGETIEAIIETLDNYFHSTDKYKYDMLCIGNWLNSDALKKNKCDNYKKWKRICRRFKYVTCSPKTDKPKEGIDNESG